MNPTELKAAAHALAKRLQADDRSAPKELADNLRGLAGDDRFVSVLALLEWQQAEYVVALASQKMAPHHGSLAHCAGSVYAIERLQQTIEGIWAKRTQSGPQPPPPEEG